MESIILFLSLPTWAFSHGSSFRGCVRVCPRRICDQQPLTPHWQVSFSYGTHVYEFLKVSPVKSSMTCNPHISLGSSRAQHFQEAQGIWSLMQRLTMLCKSRCILTPYCYSFPISHYIYIYFFWGGTYRYDGFEVLSISRHRV